MRPAPFLAALAIPAAALAQEVPVGTISGTMDLDDAVWHVALDGPAGQSGWRNTEDGREVRLIGYPQEEPGDAAGALTITFVAAGGLDEPEARDLRVVYLPEEGDLRYRAEGENVDLTLSALDMQDSDIQISGSFFAGMTPGGAAGLTVNPDEGITVDGNFQATLTRLPEPSGD